MLNHNLFYKLLIIFIAIIALLAPQLRTGSLAVTPESFKTAWGVAGISALFVFWILTNGLNYKTIIVNSPFYYPILGFLTWCFISLSWSIDGFLAAVQLASFVSVALLFFIIVNTFRDEKSIKQLLFLLVITSVLVSVLGLLQYYYPDNRNIQTFIRQAVRPAATFGNKNMAIHFRAQKLSNIIFFTSTTVICSWFLIHSSTRAGWLSVSVELLFLISFLIYDRIKNKNNPFILKTQDNNSAIVLIPLIIGLFFTGLSFLNQVSSLKPIFAILFFALLILTALITIPKTTDKVVKFHKIIIMFVGFSLWFGVINYTYKGFVSNIDSVAQRLEAITPKTAKKAGNERLPAWRNSIELIKDNFVMGVGVGQWPTIYPLYYDKVMKDKIFNERVRLRHLHNDYLELFSNFGAIGFAFLLWLAFLTMQASYKILVNPISENRYLVLGMVLALTGFSVTAIFTFPIKVYAPMLYVLVYIALIANISFRNSGDGKGANGIDKRQKYNHVRGDSKSYFVLDKNITQIIFVLSIPIFIFASIASYNFVLGENYFHNTQAVRDKKQKLLQINKSLEYNPYRAKTLLLAGSTYLKNGKIREGINFLQKSLEVSPYQTTVLLSLSQAYRSLGNQDKQLETLETFMDIDPKSVRAYCRASILYARKKDQKNANIAYQKARKNFLYFEGRKDFGPYYNEMGKTAKALGDYKFAKYVFSKAIQYNPKDANQYKNLGTIFYYSSKKQGDKLKGVQLFKRALELNPRIKQHKTLREIIRKYKV
ncbi:TPR Domain containing protein [hydrothermal vent metagenome]|uniref:TPR Domain containing protein n=1 Tax=hydrothermal vent metagenome TaxID=652676 RepID=A0A1W1BH15_9ZZZZ